MKARTGSVLDGSSLPPQLDAALDAAIEEESQNTREILKGSVSPDIGTRGGEDGLTLDPGTTNSNNDNNVESDGGILVENNTINSNNDITSSETPIIRDHRTNGSTDSKVENDVRNLQDANTTNGNNVTATDTPVVRDHRDQGQIARSKIH